MVWCFKAIQIDRIKKVQLTFFVTLSTAFNSKAVRGKLYVTVTSNYRNYLYIYQY